MASGGRRPGAGRPGGSPNKATKKRREIAERALQEGITPLEVMLRTMRALWLKAAGASGAVDPKLAKAASDIAKDAAPYVHPRLASIEHGGQLDLRNVTDGDLATEFESIARAAGFAVAGAGARESQASRPGSKKPH